MSNKDFYELTEAKTALLIQHPFFASLLLDMMRIKMDERIPTLATDGRNIFINPEYFKSLSLGKRTFGIAHEVGHAMWQHMDRGKSHESTGLCGHPFNPRLYNVAADFIINDLLIESKVGEFDPAWLHSRDYNYKMSVEEVYADLIEKYPPPPQGSGGQGTGQPGQGQPGSSDPFGKGQDEHIYQPCDDDHSDVQWKRAVQSAAAAAKAMGKLPGSLAGFIDDYMESKVSWRDLLRQTFLTTMNRDESTWTKPNRRKIFSPGIYMPGKIGVGCGTVVIGNDTSGSVSDAEQQQFVGEMVGLLEQTNPEKIIVVQCDARVQKVDEYTEASELQNGEYEVAGRGGTAFEPVFEWVIDNMDEDPVSLVYLTDMYGSFPDQVPEYPVIWVSTSGVDHAPFGEVINIEVEN